MYLFLHIYVYIYTYIYFPYPPRMVNFQDKTDILLVG
jgi:hypothetical protein